jgi:hypothetical protein
MYLVNKTIHWSIVALREANVMTPPVDEVSAAGASSGQIQAADKTSSAFDSTGPAKTLKDIVLTCAVCLVALCVAEAALHLCGARFDASLFEMDPVRSYGFRPGAHGWHTPENDVYVEINQQGNRDRLRTIDPAPGTLRIAVLGSSTTAALEVEQQETYTALLERRLSRPGAPVEVLNFAVEGYGPAQDFYTLQDQVWRFHPQIIMDEISLKQYVLNSTKKYSPNAISYPFFRVAGDDLVLDEKSQQIKRPTPQDIARSNRRRDLVNSSDLLLLVTEAGKQLSVKLKGFSLLAPATPEVADPLADPWRWTLVPPVRPEIEQGWEVLQGLILKMRDQASAHGAEFWVIASDDGFQVDPDPNVGEKLRRQMHAENLNYGDDRLENFLTEHHVNHIHLEPPLVAYVHQTGAYLHGGPKTAPGAGHWNKLGHRIVAGIIADDLEQDSPRLRQSEASAFRPGQSHL